MKTDELEIRYRRVIEDNVNVSKSSDLKEFFILIGAILVLCLILYFSADKIACIFIDRISYDTQVKIEEKLGLFTQKELEHPEVIRLKNIQSRVIKLDKRLQKKDNFKIFIDNSMEINAYIVPDGSIYFTKGLLEQEFASDEVLTFIMAHELGHYVHRDILKSVSRSLIIGLTESVLSSGQSSHLSRIMQNANSFADISYSKGAETSADLYANKVIKALYGRNDAAIEFFNQLDKNSNLPEFVHYFSTHPSPKNRIRTLQTN